MIIDFYGSFVTEFSLAYRWVGLKPFEHPTVEFFDKEVGFLWRACRDFSTGYTCIDSMMGPFMTTARTTTPLVAYDERGITYLVATNAGWLPYLADEGIRYVHYSTHKVRRKFGLDHRNGNGSGLGRVS